MRNILFIGGDARSLEVINKLHAKGNKISVIGFDQCTFSDSAIEQLFLTHDDFSIFDCLILPVNGVSENGDVPCTYSKRNFTLTQKMVASTPIHCTIFTGIASDYLKKVATERTLEMLFRRNDIAIYNAIPTAEATLQIAIEETDETIHGASVAVFGFGRVGFAVAQLFKAVGAEVTVFTRNDTDFARCASLGLKAIHIQHLAQNIATFSICINTIPAQIVGKDVLINMSQTALLIDLASKPGGTDFSTAKSLGINAIHALGLPGKTAPKTAGEILAKTVVNVLNSV